MEDFMQTMEVIDSIMEIRNLATGLAGAVFWITTLFTLLYALAQCFFGYKIMRVMYAITGFLLGLPLGFVLTQFSEGRLPGGAELLITLLCGVALGFLLFQFYKAGVFLTTMLLSGLLTMLLGMSAGLHWQHALIFALVAGIGLGVVAVKLIRPVVIITTAFSGGMTAGSALLILMGVPNQALGTVLGLVLMGLGIWVQFKTTRKPGPAGALGGPPLTPPTDTGSAGKPAPSLTPPAPAVHREAPRGMPGTGAQGAPAVAGDANAMTIWCVLGAVALIGLLWQLSNLTNIFWWTLPYPLALLLAPLPYYAAMGAAAIASVYIRPVAGVAVMGAYGLAHILAALMGHGNMWWMILSLAECMIFVWLSGMGCRRYPGMGVHYGIFGAAFVCAAAFQFAAGMLLDGNGRVDTLLCAAIVCAVLVEIACPRMIPRLPPRLKALFIRKQAAPESVQTMA